MDKYFKYIPFILLVCIVFISVGFASFSSNLTIGKISASVRANYDIRVTNFYAVSSENGGQSSFEEYNNNVIVSDISLPNADSSVSYKVEVTNLGNQVMMINKITGIPNNMTYEIVDFDLKKKICSDADPTKCTLGAKKEFTIKLKYKNGATITDNQIVRLEFEFTGFASIIHFNANGGSGTMEDVLAPFGEDVTLPANTFARNGFEFQNWNTEADGSGVTYYNEQVISNSFGEEEINITLYAQWKRKQDGLYYPGICIFNGQGHDIEGECAEGKHIDYLNTDLALFSDENYQKNFVISFTIDSVDDSLFNGNGRYNIFNALYEASDSIGKYPGVLLRIDNGKWLLQGSRGIEPDYTNKITFNKNELIGKEIKIIRHNDGETIKLYYMIGDQGPFLLKDITAMPNTFDTPLTFGASIDASNGNMVYRYSVAELNDIAVSFYPSTATLNELAGIVVQPDDRVMETVFTQIGLCTFNGETVNITGENCTDYHNINYINTGIPIFGATNLEKDFDISFDIDSYTYADQENDQATLVNAYLERNTLGYGFVLRREKGRLQLLLRDGNGAKKEIFFNDGTVLSLRIIKKGNNACYSINGGALKYLISYENIEGPFERPLTFGGSIDKNGNPFRQIKGSLSNIVVKMGKFDDSVTCNNTMN